MAPSPIPAPLPPWARFLIQVAPLIPSGLQFVIDHIGEMFDSTSTTPDSWMHIQAVGGPVSGIEIADRYVTTFDIANITNGKIDSTWTQTDMDSVATQIGNMCGAWANPHMSTDAKWIELRFYLRTFNPIEDHNPFTLSGPPVAIYPLTYVGTGATFQAPQVSITSTEKTPYPKHWGRNYWPRPSANQAVTGGYFASGQVDTWIQALHSVYGTLMASEYFPVVPVTQIQKAPARGLLGVTELQVDNLFDVQRRRRQHSKTYNRVMGLT